MNKFICLKSFGDLVIVAHSINKYSKNKKNNQILISKHLLPITKILGSSLNIITIGNKYDYPAIFNLKNSRISKIIYDFIYYIYFLHRNLLLNDSVIIDNNNIRYDLILPLTKKILIPYSKNIYISYAKFFNFDIYNLNNKLINYNSKLNIAIFPDSRIDLKKLSLSLIEVIRKKISKFDINFYVYMYTDLKNKDKYKNNFNVINYFSFNELSDIIQDNDIVISSDSLPAHLAEFFEKPVFVISPFRNEYWLPFSSFINRYWCTFNELVDNSNYLDIFIFNHFSNTKLDKN